MGCTRTRNSRFSVFFNFSFLGEKWGTRNEKSIFFIFCLILAKFWPFLMIFQSPKIFSAFSTFIKQVKSEEKTCLNFPSKTKGIIQSLSNFQCNFFMILQGRIFLVFFSFLARNGLEFLVSREKSKCEKNATYSNKRSWDP